MAGHGLRKAVGLGLFLPIVLSFVSTISPSAPVQASPPPKSLDAILATAKPGSVVTIPGCLQPPKNVDHATLTDAQLVTYGLPTRKMFKSTADFDSAVRHMKYRDCQITVGSKSQQFGISYTRDNRWGGYSEYGGNWSTSQALFTVPSLINCSSSTPGRDAVWGGIGGVSGGNLVQSGTVNWCYDSAAGNSNQAYYQAWIENLGASNHDPMYATWKPAPGDLMDSIIGGSSCSYMGISDDGPSAASVLSPV